MDKVHKKESLKRSYTRKYNSGEKSPAELILKSPGKDFEKSASEAFDDPEK